MTDASAAWLVAGVGNIFLGDDAFGCEVVRRLGGAHYGGQVQDFGVRTRELAFALAAEKAGPTVIVDAAASGARPGTLQLFDLARQRVPAPGPGQHGFDLPAALSLARALGATLAGCYLLGCQPQCFEPALDPATPLSPPVELAAARCVGLLARLLADPQQDLVALCTS